jgi:GTP-binding protein HflX
VLVSVSVGRSSASDAQDAQQELRELATSAGFTVRAELAVRRERPDPAFFVGSGKVVELGVRMRAEDAGVAVFDVALSPAQQRNLERELNALVLDRSDLILDIFQQRARSSAGRMQVELAQLEHLSTRLVRGWTHLERQRGGLGKTGGPGEKQIELDRRLIGARMKLLRKRLEQLHRQRRTQRRARERREVFSVSLVGYTNAGKSTLFNALTGAGSYAADQLFATLDTTARRSLVAPDVQVVLADTVGFIRGLPHQLVEAFKSTLEESIEADLLLHVVDAASPARDAQIATVQQVLEDIGAGGVPQLLVFNKIDLTGRAAGVERDPCDSINQVSVSATSGAGLELLRAEIAERARAAQPPARSLSQPAADHAEVRQAP